MERLAWEQTTLQGGGEATEVAGNISPLSCLSVCLFAFPPSLLPILSVLYKGSHTHTHTVCEHEFVYVHGTGEECGCVCEKGVRDTFCLSRVELCLLLCFLLHLAPPEYLAQG